MTIRWDRTHCIEAFQFPEWFITQDNEQNSSPMFGRTRLLVHRKAGTYAWGLH